MASMNLFIYGAGATGREILDIIARQRQVSLAWDKVFFVDDVTQERELRGVAILRFEEMLASTEPYECVIALGEPSLRERLHEKLRAHGVRLATVIDPQTTISASARLGDGCIVGPGSFISCDTVLGENVFLEINCIVGHDIRIGDHSVISSCSVLGGQSRIGRAAFVGMNASIREKVEIGNNSIVGMASAVFNSVGDGLIALGNPARVVQKNNDQRIFK